MNREEQLKLLFANNTNVKFGCVMFDTQENEKTVPGQGWASIDGEESFRINSTGDLSNSVKWLTNLSQDTLWKSGLVKQSKLKHSNYLKTDINQIIKELGLSDLKLTIVEMCQSLSKVFSKVMRIAVNTYGLTEFIHTDLPSEIKMKLYPNDKGISTSIDEALTRSYQDLVICEKPIIKEKLIYINLKRPRYYHAKSILETSIPKQDEDWVFLSDEDMPYHTEERIDFLLKKNKPFIAKVDITSFKPQNNLNVDLSKLIVLGEALGENGRKKERNWVSHPELLYLIQFANVEISAAFMASGYKGLDDFTKLPYLGELSDFSYSLGILSECVWLALSSRSVNPQTRSKSLVSPRACWLKSTDRFLTLTSAMMLASAGFTINSYGFGAVSVAVEENKIPYLIEIAPHAGLTVPISLINQKPIIF